MYRVAVVVEKGRGIPTPKFMQERNTYVLLKIPSTNQTYKTKIDERSLFPVWNAKFNVSVAPGCPMNFEVHDTNGIKHDRVIARLSVNVSELNSYETTKKWYTFTSVKHHTHKIEVLMSFKITTAPSKSTPKAIEPVESIKENLRSEERLNEESIPPQGFVFPVLQNIDYSAQPMYIPPTMPVNGTPVYSPLDGMYVYHINSSQSTPSNYRPEQQEYYYPYGVYENSPQP